MFRGLGVPFPRKASIKYIPSLAKIFVANTAENLAQFEKVLSLINVVPHQVEIEARFVEITQKDIEEVGLEWLLTDTWEIAQKKGSAGMPLSSRERIQIKENSSRGGFTGANRYLAVDNETEKDVKAASRSFGIDNFAGSIMSISTILTNPELTMVLHLLEQSGQANLLSAPKITTLSGEEAHIRVVREFIYPTEFSVTPATGAGNDGGNGAVIGGIVEPGGFETRDVGVILEVRPEVSEEGNIITLRLRPEVVEEPIWHDYGSIIIMPDGTENTLAMPMPFFHTRAIETTISIYDQATVVMGGMITENMRTIDDKIPFLGDVPLLGALFRSKSQYSEKRNLLIFVTARLVDPAGQPVKKAEDILEVLRGKSNTTELLSD